MFFNKLKLNIYPSLETLHKILHYVDIHYIYSINLTIVKYIIFLNLFFHLRHQFFF